MNGGAVLTRAAPPKETSILLVLIRFVEPGAFAVTIRVADPEPVASHLNDTPAVPAKACLLYTSPPTPKKMKLLSFPAP